MKNPIVSIAETEATRLKQELLGSPMGHIFQEFLRAQEVIRLYATDSTPAPMGALTRAYESLRQTRDTESSRVVKAAAAYLEKIQRRASSSEIANALMKENIEIGGPAGDEASRVSAYLSSAKNIFDNVRGAGYGLKGATYLVNELMPFNNGRTEAH